MNPTQSQWLPLLYFSNILRCCMEATQDVMALDFGTGWSIMDGVEGNGMDVAAGRLFYNLNPSSSSSKMGISIQ